MARISFLMQFLMYYCEGWKEDNGLFSLLIITQFGVGFHFLGTAVLSISRYALHSIYYVT